MTDEIDLMKKIMREYDEALRLKKINQELYDHLIGSIYYVMKYSEKYNISLPQKEALLGMVEKADFIIDQFATNHQPKGNTDNLPTRKQNLYQGSVQNMGHSLTCFLSGHGNYISTLNPMTGRSTHGCNRSNRRRNQDNQCSAKIFNCCMPH